MTIQAGTTHSAAMAAQYPDAPTELPAPSLVYLTWLDSAQHYDWAPRDGEHTLDLFTCHTIGWLIDEDETRVVLSNTLAYEPISGQNNMNGMMAIPKCAIQQRLIVPPPGGNMP